MHILDLHSWYRDDILITTLQNHLDCNLIIFFMALLPSVGPWPLFSFLILCTGGRTPWTGNQPVARPLATHRTTQRQNKRTKYRHIHASSGIRTHDYSVRASEDSSCLRPRGHCDRHLITYDMKRNQGSIGLNKTLSRTIKEMLSLKTHLLLISAISLNHIHAT
jgi:hypothetical protein